MALIERLAMIITADASQAVGEMKKVAGEAATNLGGAETKAQAVGQGMQKVGLGMVGVGAGLLAAGVAAAESTTNMGREVIKLQRYTGASAEEASRLRFAAQQSGVSIDSLTTGLGKMAKAMETSPQKFTDLGVAVKNADGSARPMTDVLGDLADKFKAMPNGAEKTAAAMELFGKGGKDLIPLLNQGRDGMAALSAEADKMGVTLSQDNVDKIQQNIKAQRELGAAFEGLKTQIGLTAIPILTSFAETMAKVPGPVKDAIGPLVVFGGLGITVVGAVTAIAGKVVEMSSSLVDGGRKALDFVRSLEMTPMAAAGATAALAALAIATVAYQNRLSDAAAEGRKAVENIAGDGTPDQKLANLRAKLDDVNTSLENLGPQGSDFISHLYAMATGADTNRSSLEAQKKELEGQIDAIGNVTPKVIDLQGAEEAVAGATSNHSAAAKELNDTLHAAMDPFFGAINAADKLDEAHRKLADANQQVFWAQVAVDDAIKKHGPTSLEAQKAAADLEQAKRGVTDASKGEAQAAVDVESNLSTLMGTMRDNPGVYQQNIDKINDWERSGRISSDTADYMRGRLWLLAIQISQVPEQHNTDMNVNTDDAEERLRRLRDSIARTANDISRGFDVAGNMSNYGGMAMGGRAGMFPGAAMGIRPSGPRLVGEIGPEIFWPDTAGTIIPANQSAQMLGGGGQATVITNNNQIIVTSMNPDDVVAAIRRYERINGKQWRDAA